MTKNRRKNIISILRGLWASFASGKGNAKTIFLCLVTAFIFWFFNSLNKEYSTRLNYPIAFDFNQDSLISKNRLPSQISINVTGGGWNLLRKTIGFSLKPIVINLEEVPNQSYLTENILLGLAGDQLDELTVNYVIADTIFVDIETKVEEQMAVKIDTSKLDLADNFFITSPIVITPDTISLVGPKSLVEAYHGVLNILIPDMDIDEDYNEKIPVSISLPFSIAANPDKVNVQFKTEQFVTHRATFKIERRNFPQHKVHLLSSATATIDFNIPASKVESIDTLSIKAIADYNNLNHSDSTIFLDISEVPDFVRSATFSNPTVKVIYQ